MNPWKNGQLKDEAGQPILFNSIVDALNYMSQRGWVVQQAYHFSNATPARYLLAKSFDDLSEQEQQEYLEKNK